VENGEVNVGFEEQMETASCPRQKREAGIPASRRLPDFMRRRDNPPKAFLINENGGHGMLFRVQVVEDGPCGPDRDLVLGGAAAEEEADF
jgi:hypothetical protein